MIKSKLSVMKTYYQKQFNVKFKYKRGVVETGAVPPSSLVYYYRIKKIILCLVAMQMKLTSKTINYFF